jgi:hypothetical protein
MCDSMRDGKVDHYDKTKLLATLLSPAHRIDNIYSSSMHYSHGCQCDGITANRDVSDAVSNNSRTLSWNGFSSV